MQRLNLIKVQHNIRDLPASVKFSSREHIKLNVYIGQSVFNTSAAKAYNVQNAFCQAADRK